eukprot:XP_001706112.1 Hypothetical protein GL50803_36063 [Giardia lamblia ATCC 50803]
MFNQVPHFITLGIRQRSLAVWLLHIRFFRQQELRALYVSVMTRCH